MPYLEGSNVSLTKGFKKVGTAENTEDEKFPCFHILYQQTAFVTLLTVKTRFLMEVLKMTLGALRICYFTTLVMLSSG